jgi:hypothetical protein
VILYSTKPRLRGAADIIPIAKLWLITTLPKTFTDAILVARELKIRFPWIDSLCIIQPSADFHTECALIHVICSRVYCALSALSSSDASGGLFVHKKEDICSPAQSSTMPTMMWDWKNELVGPLTDRGWAFQEHQISPQVIHFGSVDNLPLPQTGFEAIL